MGARLTEIRTQEEYDAAQDFGPAIGNEMWLGGSDLQVDGHWVWESNQGDISLIQFWMGGRPLSGNNVNCLAIQAQGMFDFVCSASYKSICQFD